jgi:hypothetical protein
MTHCIASKLARFESYQFLPVGTPKNPCVCSSCWQQRSTSPLHCGCLSDYPQLSQHLWMEVVVHDETCQDVHWISWRTFWALIINVLFQMEHEFNVSRHMLIQTIVLVLVYEVMPKACPQISVTPCIIHEPGQLSRYSDWLRAGRPGDRGSSPGRVKNFHFSISSRLALGSTQPPIKWVPGALSWG